MSDELTVEACLAELREMFPDAAFLHAGGYLQWRKSEGNASESIIQIEGRGFRDWTLKDCMAQVRESQAKEQPS